VQTVGRVSAWHCVGGTSPCLTVRYAWIGVQRERSRSAREVNLCLTECCCASGAHAPRIRSLSESDSVCTRVWLSCSCTGFSII
jgi:hypothetical protein